MAGRQASFTALQVAEVKALACQLPAETGTPLSRWSCPELGREVVGRSIAGSIAPSTVRRRLNQDALKSSQQSWIFVRDPVFRPKAARVLDLYARTFDGAPLGEDEYVISADEKTSIQARCRCHPTLVPGQAGRCASTTNTTAAARWPTWPPTTSIAPVWGPAAWRPTTATLGRAKQGAASSIARPVSTWAPANTARRRSARTALQGRRTVGNGGSLLGAAPMSSERKGLLIT
ncbi:hypothetical protein [Streptomyces sp. NPDC002889]|uniref:hypothetical protein n=1 Tax=Streptomyces sp. NPDC002889 TaxID=3364669 RepID=UPI0036A87968